MSLIYLGSPSFSLHIINFTHKPPLKINSFEICCIYFVVLSNKQYLNMMERATGISFSTASRTDSSRTNSASIDVSSGMSIVLSASADPSVGSKPTAPSRAARPRAAQRLTACASTADGRRHPLNIYRDSNESSERMGPFRARTKSFTACARRACD